MPDSLTSQEQAVARLIADGSDDARIAAECRLSLHKVRRAIRRLYAVSEAQSSRALVVWCQRATMVSG